MTRARADIRRSLKQTRQEMKGLSREKLRGPTAARQQLCGEQKIGSNGTFLAAISLKRHPMKQEQTMAELKTASAESTAARVKADIAADDLSAQVAALRNDLSRLTESVVALGQGAKSAVTDEASLMTEQLRDKVREEPLMALAVTAGIAYVFGLLSRR
ncbi:ElaB/YqjD/DUF883 family membrane-anchored ribosome-binding protein [Rhizobium leguminosarum]|nr:ElaB/YqjD/DUF883 family membrane-anchored ribosome-binding protein [Rhizobium leguminosarum]MDH6657867.1 ElaB/YqjD/DUF883 family membrane-anchored ribosome-binding protein [Rhizobium sophorae]MBB4327135.1 ElaB/YqjD/DUF883 family membrane-anchored ribosome-binding protein [Rhizobium leguminosarum]MBB4341406.1 ElaB/YqjD/DUF883 family membrane-anchored ribosome-binding protein [Rhizobium leguminosarum]MBB4352800.1 ElaB/YqjD/DUF883 family membrane-anchored ribosome-binding protein [Rhizobium leg